VPLVGRHLCARALLSVLLNCAVFAAYRLFFIGLFGAPGARSGASAALLRGLGLDAALLALELCILALLALVTRRLRLRAALAGLWVFTCLNALCAAVNLFVFRERHQHLWEIVPANIGRPYGAAQARAARALRDRRPVEPRPACISPPGTKAFAESRR
jgi:hypothetical protein